MSLANRTSCPNCGVAATRPLSGRLGWRECGGCTARFSYGNDPAHPQLHLELEQGFLKDTLGQQLGYRDGRWPDWRKWRRWSNGLSLLAVCGALLWWLWPMLSGWLAPARSPQAAQTLVASTMTDMGRQPALVRVFQREEAQGRVLQTVIDSIANGERLGKPQDFAVDASVPGPAVEFMHYASGHLCTVLQAQRLTCLDVAKAQFFEQTDSIKALLPAGVVSMAPQGPEWPGALRLQGKDGQSYYFNQQAAKFMPQAQALPQFAQESARYTQSWDSFALASAGEQPSSAPALSYLLSYRLQGGVGQMLYRPNVRLYRWTGKEMLSGYQPIGNGFALRNSDAEQPGLIWLTMAAPMAPRHNARLLASNASAALLLHTPQTKGADALPVLEIVGSASLSVVWSQPLASIPQLAAVGADLQAEGISSGFYLRDGPALPLLFIDNEGQVQYDFAQGKGADAGSGWLRRMLSWLD